MEDYNENTTLGDIKRAGENIYIDADEGPGSGASVVGGTAIGGKSARDEIDRI